MDNFEEIKIQAPRPGACRICAMKHDLKAPHDRDSLYYKCRFYRRHRRFPSWADAMAHCSKEVKAAATAALQKRGISVNAPVEDEAHGQQTVD